MKTYEAPSFIADLLNDKKLESLERTVKLSEYTPTPLLKGSSASCGFTLRGQEGRVYYFSEHDRRSAYEAMSDHQKSYGGFTYKDFCRKAHIPTDELYRMGITDFKKDIKKYEAFFSEVIEKGYVDKDKFNEFAKPYIGKELTFIPSEDRFHMEMGFAHDFTDTLQAFIERKFIIVPGAQRTDRTFELMRICPHCKKFFLAKAAKTLFCSPSCRVMAQRKSAAD